MGRLAELTGDEDSNDLRRTFVFMNESHSLGNALRDIISQYLDVEFCAYSIPHPAEAKMHLRIQSLGPSKAIDILRRGLKDLSAACDVTTKKFKKAANLYASQKMDTS